MVYNNKKAISPVVATALLLVVAVVAVVGFQTWFNTYQSGLNTKVEQQSQTGAAIILERLENDTAYISNKGTDEITLTDLKIDGKSCAPLSGDNPLQNGVNTVSFNTTACSLVKGDSADVVLITDNGVYSFTTLVR